jgi:hypothetical protein
LFALNNFTIMAWDAQIVGLISLGPYVIMHASTPHCTLNLSICFSSPGNILLNLPALYFSQPN